MSCVCGLGIGMHVTYQWKTLMLQWTELYTLELETCILAWIRWGSWHEHVW